MPGVERGGAVEFTNTPQVYAFRTLLTFPLCTFLGGLTRIHGWIGGASEEYQSSYAC